MSGMFDTHAHYLDPRFDEDRDLLLSSMSKRGVEKIINCSCTYSETAANRKLCAKYGDLYYSAGIHPLDASPRDIESVPLLAEFAADPKCCAIGEIGLDYHYEPEKKELQKELFAAQVRLAKQLDLPVIIHDREAHADCFGILDALRPEGVMHCFSGSAELAREYVSRGFYIAFGGVLTFSNAKKALAAAAATPLSRLLIETDCPYLAPAPHRGERNDSALMKFSLEKLAEIKGETVKNMAKITTDNAYNLFKKVKRG